MSLWKSSEVFARGLYLRWEERRVYARGFVVGYKCPALKRPEKERCSIMIPIPRGY
jgi:hypothetical protein